MKVWFLYAILGMLTIGIFSFITNIISKKGRNKHMFLFYTNFLALLISTIFLFIKGNLIFLKDFNFVLYAFITSSLYFLSLNFRFISLKYIDSVIFFPIKKIVPFFIFVPMGIYFFGDSFNVFNAFGLILAILGNILLLDKKEHKRQKNLKKGIFFCLLIVFTNIPKIAIAKIITYGGDFSKVYTQIFAYFFFSFLFSLIGVLINKKRNKKNLKISEKKKINNFRISKKDFGIFFVSSLLYYSTVLFYILSHYKADVFVVNVINSFSIIITIILSVLFLKEHINFKKIIVLILFLIAMVLFYI